MAGQKIAVRRRRRFVRLGGMLQQRVDRNHRGCDKEAQQGGGMSDDDAGPRGGLGPWNRCHIGLGKGRETRAGEGLRQRRAKEMIEAVHPHDVNDDLPIGVTEDEPRIAFIRHAAVRLDRDGRLIERVFDAIELGELVVRPGGARLGPPRPLQNRPPHPSPVYQPVLKARAITSSVECN